MFFEMVLEFKVCCDKSIACVLSSCMHSQIAIWCAHIMHWYNNMQSSYWFKIEVREVK